MKEIDIESVGDEKKKNRLVDFILVPSVYLKEVISQYEGLPFESLILDNSKEFNVEYYIANSSKEQRDQFFERVLAYVTRLIKK